jgi:hypothetical protein
MWFSLALIVEVNSTHILLAVITDGVISLPCRILHLSFHMWKVAMSFSVLAATAMVVLSSLKNALLNVDLMTYLESVVHAHHSVKTISLI